MEKTITFDENSTNAQIFEQVFGFPPHQNSRCLAPQKICFDFDTCRRCPFFNWWDKEYKPCFVYNKDEQLKEIKYEPDYKD